MENIMELKKFVKEDVVIDSTKVQALAGTIKKEEMQSIVNFGNGAVTEISKCSDEVLRNTNMEQLNTVGVHLQALDKIMDQINLKEVQRGESKNPIAKLFKDTKKEIEKFLAKYNTVGDQLDKVYVQLKGYESDIWRTNDVLEKLFNTNVDYFTELQEYIEAGDLGIMRLGEEVAEIRKRYEETQDDRLKFELQEVEQAKVVLETRVQDLRIAENIAIQSIPMLQAMKFNNTNLVNEINSAFVVTLPIFKQALAQAIVLKGQKVQAETLSALKKRTNELLITNAKDSMEITKGITKLTTGSSVDVATLEETWRIITEGLTETRKIQDEAIKNREMDKLKLEKLKEDYKKKF